MNTTSAACRTRNVRCANRLRPIIQQLCDDDAPPPRPAEHVTPISFSASSSPHILPSVASALHASSRTASLQLAPRISGAPSAKEFRRHAHAAIAGLHFVPPAAAEDLKASKQPQPQPPAEFVAHAYEAWGTATATAAAAVVQPAFYGASESGSAFAAAAPAAGEFEDALLKCLNLGRLLECTSAQQPAGEALAMRPSAWSHPEACPERELEPGPDATPSLCPVSPSSSDAEISSSDAEIDLDIHLEAALSPEGLLADAEAEAVPSLCSASPSSPDVEIDWEGLLADDGSMGAILRELGPFLPAHDLEAFQVAPSAPPTSLGDLACLQLGASEATQPQPQPPSATPAPAPALLGPLRPDLARLQLDSAPAAAARAGPAARHESDSESLGSASEAEGRHVFLVAASGATKRRRGAPAPAKGGGAKGKARKSARTVLSAPQEVRQLSLEDLKPFLHLQQTQAAHALGVCETLLKKQVRNLGVQRWPGRRVGALAKLLSETREILEADLSFPRLEHDKIRDVIAEAERMRADPRLFYLEGRRSRDAAERRESDEVAKQLQKQLESLQGSARRIREAARKLGFVPSGAA
eukprot:tig00000344_g24293.t1